MKTRHNFPRQTKTAPTLLGESGQVSGQVSGLR